MNHWTVLILNASFKDETISHVLTSCVQRCYGHGRTGRSGSTGPEYG